MPRRGSIGRWMLATALVGLGLALARSWLGPDNNFREFGPMAMLAIVGTFVALQAKGWLGRFGVGMAIAGITTSILFYYSVSWEIRQQVFDHAVYPIESLIPFDPPNSISAQSAIELAALWADLGEGTASNGLKQDQFLTVRSQGILGLLELPFALAGGLLATALWRTRKPLPDSTPLDDA